MWVVARQHPGESMAEWFVEGMLRRLLDGSDATSRKLLQNAVFYVVSATGGVRCGRVWTGVLGSGRDGAEGAGGRGTGQLWMVGEAVPTM